MVNEMSKILSRRKFNLILSGSMFSFCLSLKPAYPEETFKLMNGRGLAEKL